jgi:hypothetical protein
MVPSSGRAGSKARAPRRRVRLVGATLVLATLLAGCRLDLAVDIAVGADGAGTLAVTVGADEALLAAAQEQGADPLAVLARDGARLAADGWRTEEAPRPGGGREVRLSAAFADAAEFERLAAELAAALDAPEVTLLEDLRLRVGADELVLEGGAGLVLTDAVRAAGLSPAEAVQRLDEEDAVGYTVRLDVLGEVLETTAPDASSLPLTWELAPGERRDLHTVVAPPAPWPAAPVALAAAGALVAGLAVWAWARARRRRSA